MFFADRVLIVEGATEKALFSWLIARKWRDLSKYHVSVIDAMGKFNLHRYVALLEKFEIPYGLMLDDDEDKNHHVAINEMLKMVRVTIGFLRLFLSLKIWSRFLVKNFLIQISINQSELFKSWNQKESILTKSYC